MARKRSVSPLKAILRDLKALAELAVQGSVHAPDFHQELIRKKAAKILGRYVVTRRAVNKAMKQAGVR